MLRALAVLADVCNRLVGQNRQRLTKKKRRFAGQMYELILDLSIYCVVLALVAFGYRKLLRDENDQA